MVFALKVFSESRFFQIFTITVIIAAGVLVGLETDSELVSRYGSLFASLDKVILALFSIELIIRFGAYGRCPWRYFQDPWNTFDFIIIVACILPLGASYLSALRLVRVLRILRLVTVLPKLQILVTVLLGALPSIGYITLLLLLHFYIYAVLGTFLFGKNDPVHFGSLPIAMVSLFRVLTLEDWTDIMYIQMYGSDKYGYQNYQAIPTEPYAAPILSAAFFISFVLIGTMIILNLFVGVMMNGVAETSAEVEKSTLEKRRERGTLTVADQAKLLFRQLDELKDELQGLHARLSDDGSCEAWEDRASVSSKRAAPQLRVINGGR